MVSVTSLLPQLWRSFTTRKYRPDNFVREGDGGHKQRFKARTCSMLHALIVVVMVVVAAEVFSFDFLFRSTCVYYNKRGWLTSIASCVLAQNFQVHIIPPTHMPSPYTFSLITSKELQITTRAGTGTQDCTSFQHQNAQRQTTQRCTVQYHTLAVKRRLVISGVGLRNPPALATTETAGKRAWRGLAWRGVAWPLLPLPAIPLRWPFGPSPASSTSPGCAPCSPRRRSCELSAVNFTYSRWVDLRTRERERRKEGCTDIKAS